MVTFRSPLMLCGALAASLVAGHGYVSGIVVDGTYYRGFRPDQDLYTTTPPAVIGWATTVTDNGFVAPDAYTTGDIVCHRGAVPGKLSAPVRAGGTVEFQWTTWPDSHHGPVIEYLAPVSGDFASISKTSLQWFKSSQGGLVSGYNPGTWATDQLIANNISWTTTIPASIKPGNYVLRHEIIALHSAGNANGAQNYPQCINLVVSGSGSASPAGTPATSFYTPTTPGILFNLYTTFTSYPIPGPALYSG